MEEMIAPVMRVNFLKHAAATKSRTRPKQKRADDRPGCYVSSCLWASSVERLIGSATFSHRRAEDRKTVVALALTKHDQAVEGRLKMSQPAQRLMVSWRCNVEEMSSRVKPQWGSGATFFLEEFGHGDAEEFRTWFGARPGLGPQWVFICEEDERIVLESLQLESGLRALALSHSQAPR